MATMNTQYNNRVGTTEEYTASQNNSVGFRIRLGNTDNTDDRKKYLTAKYPHHTMKLIRKRLETEDWLDAQLRQLYDVDEDEDYDTEIDFDELLDLETTSERRTFLQEKVSNVKKSPEVINGFVNAVLEKASSL